MRCAEHTGEHATDANAIDTPAVVGDYMLADGRRRGRCSS
jgi:hypothetical protein